MSPQVTEVPGDGVLRLTSLDVENVLRIRAVHLTLDDDGALIVEGKNEQGKSSVLRSIEMLLAGGKAIADDPIHGDAKTGKIVGRFGDLSTVDHIVVEKVFRRGKSPALKITSPGARYKTPQSILSALLDTVALDPLKFRGYDDAKKAKTIADLMGFDSSALDAERARIYEERREHNREEKKLRAVIEQTSHHKDVGDKEVSVGELLEQLTAAREHNALGDELDSKLKMWKAKVQQHDAAIAELEESLAASKIAAAQCEQYAKETMANLARFAPVDEDEIRSQIDNAEEHNRQARDNARRKKVVEEWENVSILCAASEEELAKIDAEIAAARSDASSRLPVPGLTLSGGAVLYNGKPLSQAGASAELRVSVAIALAVNQDKRIKLLCLDDAEKLDADNTRLVLTMARDAGFQVIMARVGDGREASVVIEDGVAKAPEGVE
jgi:hypothetical protein